MPNDGFSLLATIVSAVLIPLLIAVIKMLGKLANSGINFIEKMNQDYATLHTMLDDIRKYQRDIAKNTQSCVKTTRSEQ